jgi:uncharacterized repeat protein (TIGR01451 family)
MSFGQQGGDRRPRMGSAAEKPESQASKPASKTVSPTPAKVEAPVSRSAPAEQMRETSADSPPPARSLNTPPVESAKMIRSTPPSHAASASPVISQPRQNQVSRTQSYYPSGDRATSAILLERSVPAEVRVGESFSYDITLTNLTGHDVSELSLTEKLPSAFNLSSSTPSSASSGDRSLSWSLGTLAARQSTTIKVTGSAAAVGDLNYCATVTFKTEICGANRAVQPELGLTLTAPAEVILCDPITLRYVVLNRGTGVARNVKVSGVLPDGWTAQDGRASVSFSAGDLAAGQSREFSVTAKASATGRFSNTANAVEDGGLTADASANTAVTVPKLVLTKSGPQTRYLGRPAKYDITISNNGDAPAKDTVIVDDVSSGARVMDAGSGQVSGGQVTWRVGAIEPGASQSFSISVVPNQIGTITNKVSAKAYCAEADAETTTDVIGIPAILLEVVDNDDPIEVGANETYDIIVINQGSAEGTNIAITCTIPPQQEYVSADGPTAATAQGKIVTFAPLPRLDPKAKATFRITVRGTAMADVRFRVSMISDQLQSPVEETESTHIYE